MLKKLFPGKKEEKIKKEGQLHKIISAEFRDGFLYLNIDEELSLQRRKTVIDMLNIYQRSYVRDLQESNLSVSGELPYLISVGDPNYLRIKVSGDIKLLFDCLRDNIMCPDNVLDQIISQISPANPVASPRI